VTEPVRTCLGCGATGPRRALVRFIVGDGGSVVVDEKHGGDGRGGWLHPAEACLSQALRRRAFARAFRRGDLAWDEAALRRAVKTVSSRNQE
jgi:predicted RNA-binding protein YlxR (DUF448 family)